MKLGEIVSRYRAEHGLSMTAFAEKAGVTKGYISQLERGLVRRQEGKASVPTIETVRKLASAMELTTDDLVKRMNGSDLIRVSREDNKPSIPVSFGRYFRLPFSTNLSAGTLQDLIEADPDSEVFIPAKFQSRKNRLHAFKISGDSMNNVFPDGSIVITEEYGSKADIHDGDIVVAFTDGGATIKRFHRSKGHIILTPDSNDPSFTPIVIDPTVNDVQIVGKVIWHMNPDNISDSY